MYLFRVKPKYKKNQKQKLPFEGMVETPGGLITVPSTEITHNSNDYAQDNKSNNAPNCSTNYCFNGSEIKIEAVF